MRAMIASMKPSETDPAAMPTPGLLVIRPEGLYCPAGDFFIDPWRRVPRAIITHAHGDHARPGSASYLTVHAGRGVLSRRMQPDALIESVEYGERKTIGSVTVSLHPAGHVLGSSQIRLEQRGHVTVVSGDYKTAADRTSAPFEPVRCQHFVTESTFGLPIYRWPSGAQIAAELSRWWSRNADAGECSVIFAYALGKAQRVLAAVDASIGPIFCHGAVENLNAAYREAKMPLPETQLAGTGSRPEFRRALVMAPPSAAGTAWMQKFAPYRTGFASGWMTVRGARRRGGYDFGFQVSDHADWPGLHQAIQDTGAEQVWVTHGSTAVMVRYLREQGRTAWELPTRFSGEQPLGALPDDAEGPAVEAEEGRGLETPGGTDENWAADMADG